MKKGDRIVYIGSDLTICPVERLVRLGKVYNVVDAFRGSNVIKIIDDSGESRWYDIKKFRLLNDIRKDKLEKLNSKESF